MSLPLPAVGAQFAVTEVIEFREEGQLVARYRPELNPYRVTDRNAVFVAGLRDSGKAVVSAAVRRRRPAGRVTVGTPQQGEG